MPIFTVSTPSPFAPLWSLDPAIAYLNHGSFGACPRAVLEAQAELRARLERQPSQLFRDLLPMLDAARARLAEFVGADADDLAFVTNATTGVSTVTASLRLGPGDELLTTDHAYNACRNALRLHEARGVRVVVVSVPFPIASPRQVTELVLAAVTPRTRFALIDHVTSPTGLVYPVETLVPALAARGIDTLVDGAHAPGMLPLDLRALGAAWYTGNCHKWLCGPKGAAFLHVRRDRQQGLMPLVIGHGFNAQGTDRSRFRHLFDWPGTHDPSPYLCVPVAIRYLGALLPGGWTELRARNRALALFAQKALSHALGIAPPAPPEMLGSLAALPLPPARHPWTPGEPGEPQDPLRRALLRDHRIEAFTHTVPTRLLRVSAQLYNDEDQYTRVAAALKDLLAREGH
jgi:isopenicillin-N epimerase